MSDSRQAKFDLNQYLKDTLGNSSVSKYDNFSFQEIRPILVCADGFTVSIQASSFHYCDPRMNGDNLYTSVELGFPSMEEELLLDYAEDSDFPTETVYGYVPVCIVEQVVDKHGGFSKTITSEERYRTDE